MPGRRIRYLVLVLGLAAYYIASGEWLSCILLVILAALPVLSLLLSIPAIRQFRISASGTELLQVGDKGELWLLGSCEKPMPPFRGSIRLEHCLTGKRMAYKPEKGLATAHCGAWRATVEKARVCDYMGLFSFRVRHSEDRILLVRPRPLEIADAPQPECSAALSWKPKPGGGFSENHELRAYRPGDSLNQIHWKLSAKTGALTIREPQEAVRGKTLLTLTHGGTPAEIDRKLGRALWMGQRLLDADMTFELRALTGAGILNLQVDSPAALEKAVDTLLVTRTAEAGDVRDSCGDAVWQYHIGGDADEA